MVEENADKLGIIVSGSLTRGVEVRLGSTVLGVGRGKSKKAAETEAARSALEQLPENFTR